MCARIISKIQFTVLRSRGLTSGLKYALFTRLGSAVENCVRRKGERRSRSTLPSRILQDFFEILSFKNSEITWKINIDESITVLHHTEAILKRITNLPLLLRKISTEELTLGVTLEYRRTSRSRKVSIRNKFDR